MGCRRIRLAAVAARPALSAVTPQPNGRPSQVESRASSRCSALRSYRSLRDGEEAPLAGNAFELVRAAVFELES
jgi:hypothetical protein